MRRPLTVIFTMISLGILLEYYLQFNIKILVLTCIVAGLFVREFKNAKWLLIILCGMLMLQFQYVSLSSLDEFAGKESVFEGVCKNHSVTDGSYGNKQISFVLKVKNAGDVSVKYYGELDERFGNESLNGRRIKVYGKLEKPTVARNPKCFDYRKHLNSNNIGYILKADRLDVEETFNSVYHAAVNKMSEFRDEFIGYLEKNIELENASFIKGMIFGIKDNMDDETYEEFQRNGTAHILAASGLNIAIIYGFLDKLFNIGRSKIKCCVAVVLFTFYLVMSDGGYSVLRAYILILVVIAGRFLHRKYDLLSALCFSGILMLCISPMALFNMGFQMSFGAVFILAVVLPRVENIEFKSKFVKDLIPVLAIQFVMTPYIMYHFNYFSLTSFVANIPVTFMANYLLPLGMSAMVVFLILGFVPEIFLMLLNFSSKLLMEANSFTYMKGIGTVDVVSPPLFLVVTFYGLFYILTNEEMIIAYLRKNHKKLWLAVSVTLCASLSMVGISTTGFEKSQVVFVDVGQGNCMFFKGENNKTLLIDGGGSPNYNIGTKTVKPFLLKNGVAKVDVALVTHLDNDHYLGIRELAAGGMIDKLALYDGNREFEKKILQECKLEKEDLIYMKKGETLNVDDDLKFRAYGPNKRTGDTNRDSLVGKVYIKDKSIFITGDIDEETENESHGNLKSFCLQVPHHGSKSSSSDELIDRVNPQIAIFQVGKNNYGHPSPEIIEKYEKLDIIIKRNDISGAIGFTIEGGEVFVSTMIEEEENYGSIRK